MVYGTGSKNLGTQKLQGAKCPSCEATQINAQAVSSYVHVFWIPVFPYRKKMTAACQSCLQVWEKKQMPPELKEKLALEKSNFKTPFYLFSGVILLGLLIAFAAYSLNEDQKALAENVKNLEANDIIVFKDKPKEYSFAKVSEVRNDTIIINLGQYTYEGDYSAPSESEFNSKKATVTNFYTEETFSFLQSKIDSLHSTGDIVEIYKNE